MGIEWAGQKYSVKLTTEPIGGEDGKRAFLGRTDETDNTIVVDGTMPRSRQEEVLIHELVHIADMTVPEFIVQIIGRNLYGILRENGLLVPNLIGRVADGEINAAEAEKLNQASNDQAEQLGMRKA